MHTPIPWEPHFITGSDGNIHEAWVSIANDVATIVEIVCENVELDRDEEYNERIKADTFLIASAPYLLKTCKYIEERISDPALKKLLQDTIALTIPK